MRSLLVCASVIALAGCAVPSSDGAVPATVSANAIPEAPDSMRWLYGSGEAASASIQTFRAMTDFVDARVKAAPRQSIAMGLPDALGGIGAVTCERADGSVKPYAVVFDVDETLLINLGYEYWQANTGSEYDPDIWAEWERTGANDVMPVPGAVTALRRMRQSGVTIIYNTNRNSATAQGTIAAIAGAGLGDAVHGETLFLKGDDDTGSAKDTRRATIAQRYCVLAMAGDNLGDFADPFNDRDKSVGERREMVSRGNIAQQWGNGWFMLPNPVYGASIRGNVNDVFPANMRWEPEAGDK